MDCHLFHGEEQRVAVSREAASVAVDSMVAAAVTGASLLAWWSVAFHPSNSRLWMVPVGLVLACTPAVVYLALSLSAEPRVQDAGTKTAPLSAVVM
ncbi:hypothetical protein D1007_31559 [Hordeum vulgare]|nr:hypothetical protein D1007_31559 [Hordeum vulgare]